MNDNGVDLRSGGVGVQLLGVGGVRPRTFCSWICRVVWGRLITASISSIRYTCSYGTLQSLNKRCYKSFKDLLVEYF